MTDPGISPSPVPLDILAREIETEAKKADDHVIAAAMRLAELKRRIEAGEAGQGVKWCQWAQAPNLNLSWSRIFELMAIAVAKDPRVELERLRKQTRERVKNFREKQAEAKQMREPDRAALVRWAKTAAIADVTRHWGHIKRALEARQTLLLPNAANSNIENAA
jgi:hypothetical protein